MLVRGGNRVGNPGEGVASEVAQVMSFVETAIPSTPEVNVSMRI